MMIHTAIAVQCSRTGRFLMRREIDDSGQPIWGLTSQASEDCFSPMSTMLEELSLIIKGGSPEVLTYVDVFRSNLHLYHCWMDGKDLCGNDGSYEWHGLYQLPEHLHQNVNDALDSKHFMELILSE